ncbi:MAG: radical SAM family heme chaperone HemW [Myxococcota bacterium]
MRDTSVYVHFPWCARKCPYCDFVTRKMAPADVPHQAYADALLRELELRRPALRERRLVSVFVGGGTPSLWAGSALAQVLRAIRDAFDHTVSDLEVTAEANPNSLTRAQVDAFLQAGINRVSIGVQSLRDGQLRFLGRLHNRNEALRAIADATERFDRTSADLMFGMPHQNEGSVREDVRDLLSTGVEHVSAYALTIEAGTQFGELHRLGKLATSSEDSYAAMFRGVEDEMQKAGLEHYEISSYARPGARARHNEHYWRAGDYLGLGTAAVGCLSDAPGHAERYKNEIRDERYLESGGESEREVLDGPTLLQEGLMLGLRTSDGVDVEALSQRAGLDWQTSRRGSVERLLARGALTLEDGRLRIPRNQWLLLDGIITNLF